MLAHHHNNNNIILQIIHQLHLGNTITPLAEEPWTTSIPRLHPTLPIRGGHHHRPHKAPIRTPTSMGGRNYPHLLQPPIPHMGPNNMLNILLAPLKNSNITHHGMFLECRNTTKSLFQNLIGNICMNLNSHHGFLRADQDKAKLLPYALDWLLSCS